MAKAIKYPGVRERDGRYTFRYSVEVVDKDGNVKRKQKETQAFSTAKAAYEEGIKIKAQQLHGTFVDEKNISIEGWGDRWVEDYQLERGTKDSTVDFRKFMLKVVKQVFGKDTRLRDISPSRYQKSLNDLKKEGKSKSYLTGFHSTCKMMFEDAVRKEIISKSPTEDAVVPAYRQKNIVTDEDEVVLPKYLEKDELKLFLQIVRFAGIWYEYAIFMVMAYTGMRLGELRALQWNDYDPVNKTLSISKTLYHKEGKRTGEYVFHTPKTKSSKRKISIGDTVCKALDALKEQQEERDLLSGFIFNHKFRKGVPVSDMHIRRRMKILLEKAGLPTSLHPHSLRHTHVSLLAENPRVKLEDIQQRLGHKNDRVTREIYLHVTKKRQQEMADDFEWVMKA